MAYIGRGIDQINNISSLDVLSFNGSSTTFNLTQNSVAFTPVSADALQIQIDGIIQAGNYTCSGSTISFDFTPSSSSVCNSVKHFGVGIITSVSDGAVTTAKLGADSITNAKMADDAIGLAELSATGTASSSTFLRGDNTWASAGGTNSGKFMVYDASVTVADATNTIVTGWSETYDLDGFFASDKYTPTVAGYYYLAATARANNIGATARFIIGIRKNGAALPLGGYDAETNIVASSYPTVSNSAIVYADGDDYFEVNLYQNSGGSTALFDVGFWGFKLI